MPSYRLHSTENRKSRAVGVIVTIFVHLVVFFVFLRMALLSVVPEPSLTIEVVMEPEPEPERLVEKIVPKPLPVRSISRLFQLAHNTASAQVKCRHIITCIGIWIVAAGRKHGTINIIARRIIDIRPRIRTLKY